MRFRREPGGDEPLERRVPLVEIELGQQAGEFVEIENHRLIAMMETKLK